MMPWQVFYSYSHKDEALRDELAKCLAPLRQKGSIVEWHDRSIKPGTDWNENITERIESADLIVALLSPDFLASEYCFGIEMEHAFSRLKRGEVMVVPVLLRPCMWEESRFSAMQIIPRDAIPITKFQSLDEAFNSVAKEIRKIVSDSKPAPTIVQLENPTEKYETAALEIVREQIRTYGRLYERTRQRLRPSAHRTTQMEEIFQKMRSLALAAYPLLEDLKQSPSPGEQLAAVSILQVFADEKSLSFLVDIIASQKPFVGYHATKALNFAVSSIDTVSYAKLQFAIQDAQLRLKTAAVGFDSDRQTILRQADHDLQAALQAQSEETARYD